MGLAYFLMLSVLCGIFGRGIFGGRRRLMMVVKVLVKRLISLLRAVFAERLFGMVMAGVPLSLISSFRVPAGRLRAEQLLDSP